MEKEDVHSSEDLQQYLQEQANKLTRLYHYTTFESLLYIIKNKSFRLSRIDLMNDKAEQKLGNKDDHLRNYVISFTRPKEYISMWAMYGKASNIKLRVDFKREIFQQAINNNFFLDSDLHNRIELYSDNLSGHFSKKGFLISDIVYYEKEKETLRHNVSQFKGLTATQSLINDMTGFIKYVAWEFEREIRLRVLMNRGISEEIPKYIYAGINDDVIRDFHITFNPWMSNEMKKIVKESLNYLAKTELKYDDSKNDGEIMELFW